MRGLCHPDVYWPTMYPDENYGAHPIGSSLRTSIKHVCLGKNKIVVNLLMGWNSAIFRNRLTCIEFRVWFETGTRDQKHVNCHVIN